MKINVGCGWECKEGWLNVDNTEKWQRVNYPLTYMDATVKWPYEDDTFEYALSEHMIEHVPEEKGLVMLKEALRTLKPGGVMRVSCPDRDFSEELRGKNYPDYIKNYCKFVWKRTPQPGDLEKIAYRTLNEQGHVWVPTTSQLVAQFEKAGFKDVKACKYGISEHAALNAVDINDGIRQYESVYVEGTK